MEGCTSGVAGADVRVTIYGNGEAACSEWNEGAAKSSDEYWKTEPQGEELHGELVCSMSKGGSLLIEVRDTGEHLRGNQICASLTAKGWHEAEGPGAKIEREQAQQKSERERAAAAEQNAQNGREAQKRQREQAQLEKEEAAKRKQEAQEHQKEQAQSEKEAAAQKQQEAEEHQKEQREHEQEAEKQQQENAREARRNEEEAKQAQREVQHSE
jgi:phage-related minor tail protein